MKRFLLVTLAIAVAPLAVLAQPYPNKPVRLVVPFAPGGTTDIVARVLAERIGPALGQPLIVENKAGGGGSVSANDTAKSLPDGYALGMATVSTTAANPAINAKIPYNPITDFTPITNVAATSNVPTFKEVGLEPVNRMAYDGIYGPKGLSEEVVDKVYSAVKKTAGQADVKKRIEETGSLVVANTPAEFVAQIKAEFEVYKGVVEAQKLKLV